jgi:hypothetical protein
VIPLSLTDAATLDWVRNEYPDVYGVPAVPPPRQPLPTVTQLVDAIKQSGCHGSAWFAIEGQDAPSIPPCPQSCDGFDLGEVSLRVKDGTRNGDLVQWKSTVESIGFRKPSGTAVLRTISNLARYAGPFLVLDDGIEDVFVLDPLDDPTRLAAAWPWSD